MKQFNFIQSAAIRGLVTLCLSAGTAAALDGPYHHPLSHHSPPGMAAAWMNAVRSYDPTWMQPLKIEVLGGGQVEVYASPQQPTPVAASPAMVAVNVGHVYRLKISGVPGLPGETVYPTIELLDRLHPPAGREQEFPIPIIVSPDDIRTALSGQLVTRVIYLEQPQLAQVLNPLKREWPQSVMPSDNALQEADRLGRPMAIIRIGGRHPSANSGPGFYGTGGVVESLAATGQSSDNAATVRMDSPRVMQQVSAQTQPQRQ